MTPLMLACELNNMKIFLAILKNGLNLLVDVRDFDGKTALMIVAEKRDSEFIPYLLSYGANINAQSKLGETALFLAATNYNPEKVDHLLFYGADANISNNGGYTPLMIATINGNKRVIKSLLEVGAETNMISNHGYSFYDLYRDCIMDYLSHVFYLTHLIFIELELVQYLDVDILSQFFEFYGVDN
jgi:ankyrin repeat protein